jgi:biotin carboxyl carrier protein
VNLNVIVDGKPRPLRIEREGEEWIADGRRASVREVEAGFYSVLLGSRSFEARVERTTEGLVVHIRGRRFLVEVSDPRRLSRAAAGVLRGGRQKITSPMPGKVVRVLVAQGDAVEAGQGLLVVEAMKMQNEMRASKGGLVKEVGVAAGAAVSTGDFLLSLES